MVSRWKLAVKVVASVIAGMVYVGSLPAKIGLVTGFYSFFVAHWHNIGFRTLVFTFLIPAPFAFEIIDFFRPKVKVELMPSGEGSSELVLRVTNVGRQGNFKGTCEVVGSRETCGIPLNKTVNLKWEGVTAAQISIATNASESLLIATRMTKAADGVMLEFSSPLSLAIT